MNTELAEVSVGITLPQQEEMKRLKAYFPFRIVWIGFLNGEFVGPFAQSTKRSVNALVRKGGVAWTL